MEYTTRNPVHARAAGLRTMPVRLAPVAGEGLDLWLEALAKSASSSWEDILIATGYRICADATTRRPVLTLNARQVAALHYTTGVATTTLWSMSAASLQSVPQGRGSHADNSDDRFAILSALPCRQRWPVAVVALSLGIRLPHPSLPARRLLSGLPSSAAGRVPTAAPRADVAPDARVPRPARVAPALPAVRGTAVRRCHGTRARWRYRSADAASDSRHHRGEDRRPRNLSPRRGECETAYAADLTLLGEQAAPAPPAGHFAAHRWGRRGRPAVGAQQRRHPCGCCRVWRTPGRTRPGVRFLARGSSRPYAAPWHLKACRRWRVASVSAAQSVTRCHGWGHQLSPPSGPVEQLRTADDHATALASPNLYRSVPALIWPEVAYPFAVSGLSLSGCVMR